MTEPQTYAANWYPAPGDDLQERYWDGKEWTSAFRPLVASPLLKQSFRLTGSAKLSPTGRFVRLLGFAAVLVGLYIGFALHTHSIGTDGKTLADLANAHPVDCGTPFVVQFSSIVCENALSGRKTTAIVLLAVGGALVVGASMVGKAEPDA